MAPLRLEVTGQATIYHPAERAVLFLSVHSEGELLDRVMNDVARESKQLTTMLSALAPKDIRGQPAADAAITHWSNSTMSTGSYVKYNEDGSKSTRIHEANMTFEAKFSDFQRLGSCTTGFSILTHVSINNIEWRLTSNTKQSLTVQCRHKAVRDAVDKAADYAKALNRPAPPVIEVRDGDSNYPVHAVTRQAMVYRGGGGAGPDISFTPEDVSLNCSVTVICEEK